MSGRSVIGKKDDGGDNLHIDLEKIVGNLFTKAFEKLIGPTMASIA